jgi:hypothetical protein
MRLLAACLEAHEERDVSIGRISGLIWRIIIILIDHRCSVAWNASEGV